jgi:hypothetical protein
MSSHLQFDAEATCDRCGRFGAFVIHEEKLCAECYELRGSCCAEFGGDDLWRRKAAGLDDGEVKENAP